MGPLTCLDAGSSNLSDSQAVERLLRGSALAQDYQLPIAPHIAALSESLPKSTTASHKKFEMFFVRLFLSYYVVNVFVLYIMC